MFGWVATARPIRVQPEIDRLGVAGMDEDDQRRGRNDRIAIHCVAIYLA